MRDEDMMTLTYKVLFHEFETKEPMLVYDDRLRKGSLMEKQIYIADLFGKRRAINCIGAISIFTLGSGNPVRRLFGSL